MVNSEINALRFARTIRRSLDEKREAFDLPFFYLSDGVLCGVLISKNRIVKPFCHGFPSWTRGFDSRHPLEYDNCPESLYLCGSQGFSFCLDFSIFCKKTGQNQPFLYI